MHPTKHVFVDFENVCDMDTTLLHDKNITFTLLLGAGQAKLDVGLVEQLLLHSASVQLVRLTTRGKNAVDFALAYYLGQAAAAAPQTAFYIISKDTGFDPLIEHLLSKNMRVLRHTDFAGIADPKPAPPAPVPIPKASPKSRAASPNGGVSVDHVLAQLKKAPANRPKSRKSLLSYLVAHHGHGMTEATAAKLADQLCQTGSLTIDAKGAITYSLG
jgi:hypothetical protein